MQIFDSHAHYDANAFRIDREEVLASLPERGVCGVINCGASLEGCYESVALAEGYPYIYAAVGLHPEDLLDAPADWLKRIEALLSHPKVVAVGEIGLDYYWKENAPREAQREAFAMQLELAAKHNLPVIIHDREAHGDTMELLRKYRPRGVLHCFSGSVEMMKEAVSLGLYIGLGGAVTFKNARVPVEVAREAPLDRLLTEADCPYMAPVPFRGKRCDSTMIAYTAEKIAEARGISADEVLEAGRRNAEELFGTERRGGAGAPQSKK